MGLGDLAKKLNKLAGNGDWEKLAAQIPDDVLDLFAAVGTFDELPEKVAARFGGISDTISVGFSLQSNAAAVSALVQKLQAIPQSIYGILILLGNRSVIMSVPGSGAIREPEFLRRPRACHRGVRYARSEGERRFTASLSETDAPEKQ